MKIEKNKNYMKKSPDEISIEVKNLGEEYDNLAIPIREKSIGQLIELGKKIDKLKELAPQPYDIQLQELIENFSDLYQTYLRTFPRKFKPEESKEKVATPVVQSPFRIFVNNWRDSLKNSKSVRDYKSDYTNIDNIAAIEAIIKYIDDDKDFELDFAKDQGKIRHQKENTNLTYSFEIHRKIENGQEKFSSYILLKTKGSDFAVQGGQRNVKDCWRYDGEWELYVNGTHLAKTEESKITRSINSKHVQVQEDGARYTSASKKSKGKQKYSTYSKKANGNLRNLPKNISFANLYSICLTSALGLADTHKAGYIHRDVKFDNILFYKEIDEQKNEFYYAKVADFGSAIRTSEAKDQPGFTGTDNWMTPGKLLAHSIDLTPKRFTIQSQLINKSKNKEIPEIKPNAIPSPQSDVFALARAFYIKFDRFLSENADRMSTSPEEEPQDIKEARNLKNYFSKIMETSPQNQPTSAEIVNYLKDRLCQIATKIPGDWERIKKHCDMPASQTLPIKNNISIFNEYKSEPREKVESFPNLVEVTDKNGQKQLVAEIIEKIESTTFNLDGGFDKPINTDSGSSIKVSTSSFIIHNGAKKLLTTLNTTSNFMAAISEFNNKTC